MTNKPLELRLSFFRQRILSQDSSGNMPELVKPESEWERAERGIEDILRWADDGGKMLDLENRTASSNPDDAWKRRNLR